MKQIDTELINAIPSSVTPDRASAENAADAALHVLFLIGAQVPGQTFPPLLSSTGVEVWPTPAPWNYPTDEGKNTYVSRLNESLPHTKKNADAFNAAVAAGDKEEAEDICKVCPKDSGQIWNDSNGLARAVETASVYRTLELSAETQQAYKLATGPGLPDQTKDREKLDELQTKYHRNKTSEDRT